MDSRLCLFLFLVAFCKCAEAAQYTLYKDSSQPISARVDDLLARMTLEEKIGQMTQIERSVATPDVVKNYYIGSVLSGGGSAPAPKASPATWMNMVDGFQKGAMATRLQIPMIYGIDAVHGHNNVYGATIFPHNIGLGATRDPDLVKRIGAATALEIRSTGIQYTFAPCVAVCRDPRWGRCYESYSEDPTIVKSMTEIIFGLQGQPPANFTKGVPFVAGQSNVVACAKHFVGDGGTTQGVDESNTVSSYKQLVNIHMTPYFDAIAKGVSTIMVSYSSWNGQKMHANRFLISHVLKKQLRFQGFVISDWQGIDRITIPPNANYSLSVLESVGAGIDMVMVPDNFADFINDLTMQVKGGFIPMSRINDVVQRILTVKFTMGLFEHPMGDPSLANQLGSKVAELVRNAVPLALTAEDDPRRQEMERLQKEKEEIDRIAHKHVRRVLWSGLGSLSVVTILFFRLTFWEFSWDVMEPIAFFGTTGGLIVGYLYFLVTSRDPTYQDFMKRLLLRRQRKLCKKRKFDVDRFLELQKQCKSSLDSKRDLEALVRDSS